MEGMVVQRSDGTRSIYFILDRTNIITLSGDRKTTCYGIAVIRRRGINFIKVKLFKGA